MTNSIYHSQLIYNLNERLFINTLAGVTDAQAAKRVSEHNNPLVWLAAHTTWARYNTAALLGNPGHNPYAGLFEGFKPFDASMKFDTLDNIKKEWKKASELVREGFKTVTEKHLAGEAPFQNPTDDKTMGGAIAFLAQHESYEIGQMGFLKKYLTKEAMSYS